MPFFQNSVTNKYLKTLDKQKVSDAYAKFKEHFHNPVHQENIRNSKEEQYQEGFLTDLFVESLGYIKNPKTNFNLTTEYKNIKDAKKVDGAIIINDKVKVVIELKGTDTTDLGKVEEQAFGYKNNQPECTYVIISNFEKLRFYIDNAIEHFEFNLFTLTEQEFELLYLCVAFENISKDLPKQLKNESLSSEDVITKKLYADYSAFRRVLFQNIVQQNPQIDKLVLFKKTQKLLDRFLFIFFAEDRQLLPPNSIRTILDEWKQLQELDSYKALWERFKLYFHYMNIGRKGKKYDIFPYNGGLFLPDTILDSISIDDDILYEHTLKLSNYDFDTEVDVDILGHIFEHSLNEIEEIQSELEGKELDKTKTKRKKDGIFYTPKYITKYIVDNTVGKLCAEKKTELQINEADYISDKKIQKQTKQALADKLTQYRNWLLQIKICDPACGSGAFLNQALDFLIKEHRYIDELQAKLFGASLILSDFENSILENNLFGVDLNEESVEIARLSLWLRTARPNRKLNDLSNNIKCGNSLIDDQAVAGDKAFNWFLEFPQVFIVKEKKAWHVVFALHNSRYVDATFGTDGLTRRFGDAGRSGYARRSVYNEPGFVAHNFPRLVAEEEEILADCLSTVVDEKQLNILACNICEDHVHAVMVCDPEELESNMRLWKGRTAYLYNRRVNPSVDDQLAEYADGTKQKLWAKSFHATEIIDETQLQNTLSYIINNRAKHKMAAATDGLTRRLFQIICTPEHAYRTEYKHGFDVVIGNPPYVDIKALPLNIVEYIFKNYKTANNRINLFAIFLEKVSDILKINGKFSFIIPSSVLTQDSYKLIRNKILFKFNINNIVRLPNESFGGNAGEVKVDTVIFTSTFSTNIDSPVEILIYKGFGRINEITSLNCDNLFYIDQSIWREDKNFVFRINTNDSIFDLVAKIENGTTALSNCADFSLGITPYDKYKGHTPEQINQRIYHSSTKKDETYKMLLAGNDVKRYNIGWNGKEWISYGNWLGAQREVRFFKEKRILIKQIIDWTAKRIWAAITREELYNTQNAFNIIANENYLAEYLLVLINSKLMSFYHRKKYLEEYKDRFQKILIKDCKNFPIKKIPKESQLPFIQKADLMLTLNKQLQDLSQKFQRTILREFSLTDLSTKLQNWYHLTYTDFIKELDKKKVKLTLAQKAEWEEYFISESKKAIDIKEQIDKTDEEIDQMVYQLYGLTKEEIRIVEGK